MSDLVPVHHNDKRADMSCMHACRKLPILTLRTLQSWCKPACIVNHWQRICHGHASFCIACVVVNKIAKMDSTWKAGKCATPSESMKASMPDFSTAHVVTHACIGMQLQHAAKAFHVWPTHIHTNSLSVGLWSCSNDIPCHVQACCY